MGHQKDKIRILKKRNYFKSFRLSSALICYNQFEVAKKIFLFEIVTFSLILIVPFFYNLIVLKPQLDKFRTSLSNYVFDNQIKINDRDRSKAINEGGILFWKTNLDDKAKNAAMIEMKTSPLIRFGTLSSEMYGPYGTTSILFQPDVLGAPRRSDYDKDSFRAALIRHIKDQRLIDAIKDKKEGQLQLTGEADGLNYISFYENNATWKFDNAKLFSHINLTPPSIDNSLFGDLRFSIEGFGLHNLSYLLLTDGRNYSPLSSMVTVELVLLLFIVSFSYLLSQLIFRNVNSLIIYNIVFIAVFVPIFWFSFIPLVLIALVLRMF